LFDAASLRNVAYALYFQPAAQLIFSAFAAKRLAACFSHLSSGAARHLTGRFSVAVAFSFSAWNHIFQRRIIILIGLLAAPPELNTIRTYLKRAGNKITIDNCISAGRNGHQKKIADILAGKLFKKIPSFGTTITALDE
jgi:hypothetical protein